LRPLRPSNRSNGGEPGVSVLGGKVDDRLRPKSTIKVIV
jgi:hypothetical protein